MKVRITATERVVYDKTVNMTRREFRELKDMADESEGMGLPIEADAFWLDPSLDIIDSQGLEGICVEEVK
jgi:hypothetical protein